MISVTEIILIAVGVLAVIVGYLIPNGSDSSGFDFDNANQKINDMVSKAIKNSQGQIDEMLDDCMEEAINKAERAMDRVTNEKMSAISEYSDTVMNDIHKNHDEVVFMYDMLNDKHKNLKNTVSEANRAAQEVKAAEARRLAELEEEAKRQTELQAKAKEQAKREAEAKKQAEREEEARRKAQIEAEARRKAEAEEEARRKEEARRAEEARIKAEEEAAAKVQAEIEAAAKKQTDVTFSSLADILDRADAAAAKKTQNRIIGSEPELQNSSESDINEFLTEEEPMELHTKYWPDTDEEDFLDDIADEVTESSDENEKSAKVVSISDAPRKKANSEEVQTNDSVNDPASRNQRILDMHKQGKSAVVIARELRLGIGEVKLVIDLAAKHKKNRSSIM